MFKYPWEGRKKENEKQRKKEREAASVWKGLVKKAGILN